MGLFGFGSKKTGSGKVARLEKRVTNKWGQTLERQRALQMLADLGTDEALAALLKRFTFNTEGAISDEDEKRLAYQLLVGAGERAVGPIETFVGSSDGVYWPLRALKEIVGMDQTVELLMRALDRAETVTGRVNEQKAQLVSNLRDFPHPLVLARLKAFCADPNDEVRIMAVDGLMTYGEAEALPVIAARLLHPDETNRIRSVVFEQLVELGWSLKPWRDQLLEAEIFPVHYRLGPKGNVIRG